MTPIEVASIVPTFGRAVGGTEISIYGQHFVNSPLLTCHFGNTTSTPATYVMTTQVKCVTPPSGGRTSINVSISLTPSILFPEMVTSVKFTYKSAVGILAASSDQGPVYGNTRIVFDMNSTEIEVENPKCKFDATVVNAQLQNGHQVVCYSPPVPSMRAYKVQISMNGVDFEQATHVFNYFHGNAKVAHYSPRSCNLAGNEDVFLTVSSIEPNAGYFCHFGDIVVPASFISNETLRCSCPPSITPKQVYLGISLDGQNAHNYASKIFLYKSKAGMAFISPSFGPAAGGTRVLVQISENSKFAALSSPSCVVDGIHVTTIWTGGEGVECVMPPASNSIKKVNISIVDVTLGATFDANSFEYVPNPRISFATPIEGSVRGGTRIYIHGEYFLNASSLACKIAGNVVKATYFNDTSISCVTPFAGFPHSAAISVSVNGIDFVDTGLEFLFRDDPAIFTILPTYGPISGNTPIRLHHSHVNSSANLWCSFSNLVYVKARRIDVQTAECFTPQSEEGIATVGLTVNAKDNMHGNVTFAFTQTHAKLSAYPLSGPESGGTRLTFDISRVGKTKMRPASLAAAHHQLL